MAKTLVKKLFAVISVAVIACSASHAHERESFHNQELQPIFQQINQYYFAGELKNVEVRWANLKSEDARGITRFYDNGSFLIEIDRARNTTRRYARMVLRHEACHVSTYVQIEQEHSDLH